LRAAPLLLALVLLSAHAADPPEAARPKDAAEEVQEGNVDNWIKYYQRERGLAPPPAPTPPVQPAPPADPPPAHRR
jgi:hypothetical protein